VTYRKVQENSGVGFRKIQVFEGCPGQVRCHAWALSLFPHAKLRSRIKEWCQE
jgi:hypothetical protein